jgi:hypothetical protein
VLPLADSGTISCSSSSFDDSLFLLDLTLTKALLLDDAVVVAVVGEKRLPSSAFGTL